MTVTNLDQPLSFSSRCREVAHEAHSLTRIYSRVTPHLFSLSLSPSLPRSVYFIAHCNKTTTAAV